MTRDRLWLWSAVLFLPAFASAAPTAVFREKVIPGPPASVTEVVGGLDGSWFTEFDGNRIGRISPDGKYSEFTVPTPDSGPRGIAWNSDAIWFTEFKAGKIGRLSFDGVFTEYVIPTAGSAPWGIVVANGVWFTESAANKIGRVNGDGSITELSIPTANAMPRGVAEGFNLELCFAEFGANQIGCIENNQIVERVLPNPDSGPEGMGGQTDFGDVWFTESEGNRIGVLHPARSLALSRLEEFAVPTPASGLSGMVVDFNQGAAWFTEKSAGQIGFVFPGGRITEYPLTDRSSQPTGISFGFDSRVRFLEQARNRLVEIEPDAVLLGGAGISGTWQTEFRFANVESSPVTVFAGIFNRPTGICPGVCSIPSLVRGIPSNGSSAAGTDVLRLRGLGLVFVRVLEDGTLPSVKARIFNASAPAQSLDLPTIRLSRLTELNPSSLSFPGEVKDGAAHSNLWLAEVSQREPLNVVIELINPSGTVVASDEETLGAGQSVYLVDVIARLGVANFLEGQLRVRKVGDSGLLWGYLATVNADGAISIFSGLNP
jgi:virginiamycin B lyase